jgi:hypothetical protein
MVNLDRAQLAFGVVGDDFVSYARFTEALAATGR